MSSALQQSNREKPMKEFQCIECGKKYSSQNALNTHKKNKHQEKLKSQQSKEKFVESKGDRGRPKGSTKTNHKNKSFEQYQQELEDKIYAYLGELGEKHFDEERELSGEQDSQKRLTGQANYLQNNVVRTPFENQFQISQEIPRNFIQESPHKPLFQALIKDMNSVHAKLSEQRDKWDFKDPLEADDEQDQQFSLIEINNVIKNGKKKGLEMLYPEFSVFLLWIGKICKPTAWKQFFLVLGYLQSQYCEFLRTKGIQRNQVSWKTFTNEFQQKLKEELPAQISKHIEIIQKEDLLNFLKLYYKWVLYFDVL